jgi:hypothetical protein
MQEYLSRLPDGLDSYPECRAKASLYRAVFDNRSRDDDFADRLPAALRPLALHLLPVTAWLPEVHSHAILLAMCDAWFESPAAYLRHAYATQRELFSGPLYSILLRVATPRMLIRGASVRWHAFHRGTDIHARMVDRNAATIELVSPPDLWDPLATQALAEGFRALLDLSGSKHTDVRVLTSAAGGIEFSATWR